MIFSRPPRNYQIYVQACLENDYPKKVENYTSEMYAGTDGDTLWESFGKKIMEGIAKGDKSVVNTVFDDLLKRLPSDPNIAKTSFPVRAKDYIDFLVKKSRAFLCRNDENDLDVMKRYEWRSFLGAIAHYKDTFEHRITEAQEDYEKRLRYLQGKDCGHIILGTNIEDKFREIYKHNLVKYGEKAVDLHTLKDSLRTFSEMITYAEPKQVILDILDMLAPNAAYNSLRDKTLYASLYAQIAPKLAKGQPQGR